MAVVMFTGFEAGTLLEARSTSGTRSVSNTYAHTGTYSFRTNPTTTGTGLAYLGGISTTGVFADFAISTVGVGFWFRVETLPASSAESFFCLQTSTPSLKLRLRITSTGKVQLFDEATAQVGSDSSATISTGVWYHIGVKCGIESGGGSNAVYDVTINHVSQWSGSNGNFGTANTARVYFGKDVNVNGQTVDFYFDDIIIDNAGDIYAAKVAALLPTGDGNQTGWTASTGNKYQCIDEVPYSSSDYIYTATNGARYSCAVTDSSTAGAVSPIYGLFVQNYHWEPSSVSSAVRVGIWHNSTAYQHSSNRNASTSVAFQGYLLANDPVTLQPWTTSAIDGVEATVVENAAVQINSAALYIMAAYTSETTGTKTLTGGALLSSTGTKTLTGGACVPFTTTRQHICGFEAGDDSEVRQAAGTYSIVSSPVNSGSYAFRCNPTTTGTGYFDLETLDAYGRPTTINLSDVWVKCHFRVATAPSSNYEPILRFYNSGFVVTKGTLNLNSDRKLEVRNTSDALVATGSTVLSLDTWYAIEMKCPTGSSASYEVKVGGTTELSGTGDFSIVNTQYIYFGKSVNRNSQTVDFYLDDIVIDNAGFPGANSKVARLDPDGNGTYTGWTASAGAKWECVDETPHDSSTTNISTSTTEAYSATLESCSSAGISGTIKCVIAVAWNNTYTHSRQGKTRLMSGSAEKDTTATIWDTGTGYPYYAVLSQCDPNTGAAWTTTALDAAEVGVVVSGGSGTGYSTKLALMVEYAVSETTGTKTLSGGALLLSTGTKTLTGGGLCSATGTKTLSGGGLCLSTGTKTLVGGALLQGAGSVALTGGARLLSAATKTLAGGSRLLDTLTKTLTGGGRAQSSQTVVLAGGGNVLSAGNIVLSGGSILVTAQTITLSGGAVLASTGTRTLTGGGGLATTGTKTLTGGSRVVVTQTLLLDGGGALLGETSLRNRGANLSPWGLDLPVLDDDFNADDAAVVAGCYSPGPEATSAPMGANLCPWGLDIPTVDDDVTAADRALLAGAYGGIAIDPPPARVLMPAEELCRGVGL